MLDLNIVLYSPEIPQNTGNIMRTCVGTNATLHLIKPISFKVDEKSLIRAGVNYHHHLKMMIYEDFSDFFRKNQGTFFYLTRYGKTPPSRIDFKKYEHTKIYLVFGKESTGLPFSLLHNNLDFCFRYPMSENIRSLNLSNCVAISIYEVLRQFDYEGLCMTEPESMKGENFIY